MSDAISALLFWSLFAALAIFLSYFLTRTTTIQSGGASPGLESASKAPDGPIFVKHVGFAAGLSLFSVAYFGNVRYKELGWFVGTVASFLLVGIVDIVMGIGLLFTSKKDLARRTLAYGTGVLGLGVLIFFVVVGLFILSWEGHPPAQPPSFHHFHPPQTPCHHLLT